MKLSQKEWNVYFLLMIFLMQTSNKIFFSFPILPYSKRNWRGISKYIQHNRTDQKTKNEEGGKMKVCGKSKHEVEMLHGPGA
jgi:hypothetical protein